MKKSTKIALISTICSIFLIILVLGSIFDLQISEVLADLTVGNYYSKNLFAVIFETFGESIVYILSIIALSILFFKARKTEFEKKHVKYLLMLLCVLLSIAVSVYGVLKAVKYLKIHAGLEEFFHTTISIVVIVAVTSAILLATYSLCSLINDSTLDTLYKWAMAVLVVAIASNGIAQVAKHIFHRVRFRAMVYEGFTDYAYYTPWFVINTNRFVPLSSMAGDYFKSFPSGHCCAGASIFLLLLLPLFCPKLDNKKCKASLLVLSISYTLCVMLSRIVAGAHYFTDTLIGSGITILCIVVYYFAVIKNKKIKYFSY